MGRPAVGGGRGYHRPGARQLSEETRMLAGRAVEQKGKGKAERHVIVVMPPRTRPPNKNE